MFPSQIRPGTVANSKLIQLNQLPFFNGGSSATKCPHYWSPGESRLGEAVHCAIPIRRCPAG